MTARNVWICVFGSNFFNQLDPNDTSSSTKKILHPRILSGAIPADAISVNILHSSDSQSLVHYTTPSEINSNSSFLQIWGFDESVNAIISKRFQLEPLANNACILHSIDQVKLWLGRSKIAGYLARDGTINPFNLKCMEDSFRSESRPAASRGDRPSYLAVTISDNGQALAAVAIDTIQQMEDVHTRTKTIHRLELWPSFQELLDFAFYGIKTDFNPKSFTLTESSYGQTEVQLASGASHFLILTQTPYSPQSRERNRPYHSTLYALGDNRFGQLGVGTVSVSVDEPKVIEGMTNTLKIDCGLFHSVAIGKDGELYAFGLNRKGQCGVGSQEADLTSPLLIDLGGNGESGHVIDVVEASCGSEHTVLLTSSGVWAAGSNDLGQLGLRKPDGQLEFQMIDTIYSSGNHTGKTPSNWKIKAGRWNTFIWSKSRSNEV